MTIEFMGWALAVLAAVVSIGLLAAWINPSTRSLVSPYAKWIWWSCLAVGLIGIGAAVAGIIKRRTAPDGSEGTAEDAAGAIARSRDVFSSAIAVLRANAAEAEADILVRGELRGEESAAFDEARARIAAIADPTERADALIALVESRK